MTFEHPSLRCAECRYDLRGITAPICPECAHPVELSRYGIPNVASGTLTKIARGARLLVYATATFAALGPIAIGAAFLASIELLVLLGVAFLAFTLLVGVGMWFFTTPLAPTLRTVNPLLRIIARWVGVTQGLYVLIFATLAALAVNSFAASQGVGVGWGLLSTLSLGLAFGGPPIFAAYARALAIATQIPIAQSRATASLVISAALVPGLIFSVAVFTVFPFIYCFVIAAIPIVAIALVVINTLLLTTLASNLNDRAHMAAGLEAEQ